MPRYLVRFIRAVSRVGLCACVWWTAVGCAAGRVGWIGHPYFCWFASAYGPDGRCAELPSHRYRVAGGFSLRVMGKSRYGFACHCPRTVGDAIAAYLEMPTSVLFEADARVPSTIAPSGPFRNPATASRSVVRRVIKRLAS